MPIKDPEKQRENSRRWYEANKERRAKIRQQWFEANRERQMDLQARWAMERRQKLAEYKLERGCAVCGYRDHPAALHFDHLPGKGKTGTVSQIYKRKWETVLKEIEKCQILCANCHAIATAERGYAKRGKRMEVARQASLMRANDA